MLAKQDGGRPFEYTEKTGHFEKSLLLTRTLAARCPNAKFVHKYSLCFMKIIIFQLLSCLYFYDSEIEVPVYLVYFLTFTETLENKPGIPVSGAVWKFTQTRYTGFWRHREVCAKPVYRFLAP